MEEFEIKQYGIMSVIINYFENKQFSVTKLRKYSKKEDPFLISLTLHCLQRMGYLDHIKTKCEHPEDEIFVMNDKSRSFFEDFDKCIAKIRHEIDMKYSANKDKGK